MGRTAPFKMAAPMGDSSSMEVVLLGAGFVIAGIALAVVAHGRARRLRDLRAAVQRSGLSYSTEDPFASATPPFELFRRGDLRGAEHVVWRDDHPDNARVFDYWWADEYRDEKGRVRRVYRRCTAGTVEGGWMWPELTVDPETALSRAADRLGGSDIQLESDEFNRLFEVHCADRRFATAFLDARMIDLLTSTRGEFHLHVKNRWLLLWSDTELPGRLFPHFLGLLEAIRAAVPRVVYEWYPVPERTAPVMPPPVRPPEPPTGGDRNPFPLSWNHWSPRQWS